MVESNQTDRVKKRLQIILKKGGYGNAKETLDKKGLLTGKRNYTLLNSSKQSPTMVTLPDDFIHYKYSLQISKLVVSEFCLLDRILGILNCLSFIST